jgi:hypothetical protein
MDTIIEEFINDITLWGKAAVSLALDGYSLYYNLLLNRYEYLRQKQEEIKKKSNKRYGECSGL